MHDYIYVGISTKKIISIIKYQTSISINIINGCIMIIDIDSTMFYLECIALISEYSVGSRSKTWIKSSNPILMAQHMPHAVNLRLTAPFTCAQSHSQ